MDDPDRTNSCKPSHSRRVHHADNVMERLAAHLELVMKKPPTKPRVSGEGPM